MFKYAKKCTCLNQLDHHFSCSIIGTCLTLDELRKLGRKIKLANLNQISDYQLHHIYVGIAQETSYANRSLQKFLDQKYQIIIKQFTKIKDEKELKKQWGNALKTGDISAAYWGLITHPAMTQKLIGEIYADVHMLSHIAGASMRVDLHKFSLLRSENKLLKQQQQQTYQKHRHTLYDKDALLRKQTKQLQKQQLEINALKVALMREPQSSDTRSDHVSNSKHKLQLAKEKISQLEQKSTSYRLKWEIAISKQLSLKNQLQQSNDDLKIAESLLNAHLLSQQDKSCQATEHCPHKNIKGKCIVYIGGRDRQCHYFKILVENCNGTFIHHDGGLNQSSQKLDSTLMKADAVMCPLDCISHAAMIKVKKHCQFTEKPLVMMSHSSLSAFNKGLSDII